MYTLLLNSTIEYARERQAFLRAEADKHRLLQQVAKQARPFLFFRHAILVTGNLLIAGGLWLKASTRLEQSRAADQPMPGHYPNTVLQ